jgi:ribosomal-protein-alanine N-acetyltransferase
MNETELSSFPLLTTERILLRQLEESDAGEIFFLRSDTNVNRYIDRPKAKSVEDAMEFINKINSGIKVNKWFYWAASLKGDSKLIGTVCLWNFSEDKKAAEIGYELNPAFQGKGYMNEVLKEVIEFGFNKLKIYKIDAYTHKDNVKSTNLLLKNNFKLDAERKDKENENNIIFTLRRG